MNAQQALDFLASAAQQTLPIARLTDYNEAVTALKKLVDDEAAREAIAKDKAP